MLAIPQAVQQPKESCRARRCARGGTRTATSAISAMASISPVLEIGRIFAPYPTYEWITWASRARPFGNFPAGRSIGEAMVRVHEPLPCRSMRGSDILAFLPASDVIHQSLKMEVWRRGEVYSLWTQNKRIAATDRGGVPTTCIQPLRHPTRNRRY
jgi:hypothetical protein